MFKEHGSVIVCGVQGTVLKQLIVKPRHTARRAVHENVLPAVVNTSAAVAEACQSSISLQSCHVCHLILAGLCAWASAMCHLQSRVCSGCLSHMLQLVKPLCCVAMWAVRSLWCISANHWSLMQLDWCQYFLAYMYIVQRHHHQFTAGKECLNMLQWCAANVKFVCVYIFG